MSAPDPWPTLTVDSWTDTRETLHMWLQVVGKIQLMSTPLINHWWNITYEVTARGLRTRLMHGTAKEVDAEFDFLAERLTFRASDGGSAHVVLAPKTVAAFYAETETALAGLGLHVSIEAAPNEVAPAIPFAKDTVHASYDAEAVRSWWRQLLAANRVFTQWRAGFAGKDSPVQVFWGSMDLSCSRYSGRLAPPHHGAPPNCPDWVMTEAESRENASAGFWSGGSAEGSFYAYAYPEPDGYRAGTLTHGRFDETLGEWILPYQDVRTSADPAKTLLTFLQETYDLAADLGHWDRALLDIDPHRLDAELFGAAGR